MKNELDSIARLSGWQPDALAGWKVGDLADVPSLGRVQVAAIKPPSEIVVRTRTGASARVGYKALQRIPEARR